MTVWPDFDAPAQYENPPDGWEDPRLPDFRKIWSVAKACGYAVGLHGSMKRDCDMIAVPWVGNPSNISVFTHRLCNALGARIVGDIETKHHGRIALTIQVDGYVKPIDLSIVQPT